MSIRRQFGSTSYRDNLGHEISKQEFNTIYPQQKGSIVTQSGSKTYYDSLHERVTREEYNNLGKK